MAFSVTYNGNGSTAGNPPIDSNQYAIGQYAIVLDNTGGLTQETFAFDGWNTEPDGSGVDYIAGLAFIVEKNTTLYAKWEKNYLQKSLTTYKLSPSLKIDDLWIDFMTAISQELLLQKQQIEKTKDIKNIYMLLEDDLLNYCQKFGYIPNLVIDNSIEFLLEEIESISYRIRNKTTYNGYSFGFKRLNGSQNLLPILRSQNQKVIGDTFNIFYNGQKLLKAINWVTSFNTFDSTTDFTVPFTGIVPNKNFSTINTSPLVSLDTGRNLDEDTLWYLDDNLVIVPIKHLAIEYYLNILYPNPHYSIEGDTNQFCLLYEDLETFYENEAFYNRRVPVYSHVGGQLTIVISDKGGLNYYNPSFTHTIPQLLLNSAVTDNYLTQKAQGADMTQVPKYISYGTGSKSMLDNTNVNLFDSSLLVFCFNMDEAYGKTCYSDSLINVNNYAIITGNKGRIPSILGQSVNFSGNTYLTSHNTMGVTGSDNLTYHFWFNPNSASNTPLTIFDNSVLRVDFNYNSITPALILILGTDTFVVASSLLTFNNPHLVQIEIHGSLSQISVFVDATFVETINTSDFVSGSYPLIIGATSTHTQIYKGLLDNVLLIKKHFTQTEKDYIFNNKISSITSLQNPISRVVLGKGEVVPDANRPNLAITSQLTGNYAYDEFGFSIDNPSVNTQFNGKTKLKSILPNFFTVNYTILIGGATYEYSVKDNGTGTFLSKNTDGTLAVFKGSINYETGNFNINLAPIFSQTTTLNPDLSSISTPYYVSTLLPNSLLPQGMKVQIQRFSVALYYTVTIGAGIQSFLAKDDGVGNLLDAQNNIIGEVGYASNNIIINSFGPGITESTPGHAVTLNYNYTTELNNNISIEASMSYLTSNVLNVTEIAIEDANKRVLAYATFPPIRLKSYQNHISPVFIIEQS